MKAALVLEDGAVFEGASFGKAGEAFGETVFYTGVVGYQEVITDPSYRGTLVVLTYPMIGSYGVAASDSQSPRAQAAGVVIRDYSARYSNFRATGAFEDFLCQEGVVGVRGVDTRAVTVHLRENGEMKGMIVSGDFDRAAVAGRIKKAPSPFEKDLTDGASLVLLGGPAGRKLALFDVGAARGLIGQLSDLGFSQIEPAGDMGTIRAAKPVGLIVAGGPGDPRNAGGAAAAVKSALGEMPVLGVGLGHGLLALGVGCRVLRMKVGHHGANHSVRDLEAGRCIITAQHHCFAVEAEVPPGVEVTHTNVNDGTVEGIRCRGVKARGVAFQPSRDDFGAPSAILERFVKGRDA